MGEVANSFNSSVGILSVGTHPGVTVFQFYEHGFNSSVGILSVGTDWQLLNEIEREVSIPQSEFCPLGPKRSTSEPSPRTVSFNSSVGILSVGTSQVGPMATLCRCFNSSVGILSVGTRPERGWT